MVLFNHNWCRHNRSVVNYTAKKFCNSCSPFDLWCFTESFLRTVPWLNGRGLVRKWWEILCCMRSAGQFWDSSVLSCWLYIHSEPTHLLNITVSCTVLLVGTNIPRANHRSFHCRCSLFRVLYFILSTGLAVCFILIALTVDNCFSCRFVFNGDILSVLSCVLKCFQNESFNFVLSLGNFLVLFW